MKLLAWTGSSLGVAGVTILLSLPSGSMAREPHPLSLAQCWSIQTWECLDCPGVMSYACNPDRWGVYVDCSAFLTYCSEDKACQQVNLQTGAGCPPNP